MVDSVTEILIKGVITVRIFWLFIAFYIFIRLIPEVPILWNPVKKSI